MCVALVIDNAAILPTLDEYKEMEETNDDGAGVGWAEPSKGLCHWRKGLKAEEVYETVAELAGSDQLGEACILVHFRLATLGGVNPLLTHPFVLSPETPLALTGSTKDSLLIHNGHWAGYWQYKQVLDYAHPIPKADTVWSDTRYGARFAALGYMPPGEITGKVAVLRPDGGVTYWGDWNEQNGVLYSNTYWRGGRTWKRSKGSHGGKDGSTGTGAGASTCGSPGAIGFQGRDDSGEFCTVYPGPGYVWTSTKGWVKEGSASHLTSNGAYEYREDGFWYKNGVRLPPEKQNPAQYAATKAANEAAAAGKKPEDLPEITVEMAVVTDADDGSALFSEAERRAMRLDTYVDGSRVPLVDPRKIASQPIRCIHGQEAGICLYCGDPEGNDGDDRYNEARRYQSSGYALSAEEKDEIVEAVRESGCAHTDRPGVICASCYLEFELQPEDLRGGCRVAQHVE